MKKDQVKVGGRYTAKVSGQVVPVCITGERWVGDEQRGWNAVNSATNRPVVIKSAQRLRAELPDAAPGGGAPKDGPGAKPGAEAATGANVAGVAGDGAKRACPAPTGAPVRAVRVIGAKPAAPAMAPAWPPPGATVAAAGSPRPPKPGKGAKAKAPKAAKPTKEPKAKRMSGLEACAKVLAESKEPMGAKAMVEEALKRGLWKTGGKTPEATIYAAIIRDIAARRKESRFRKVERGLFAAAKE